MRSLIVSHNIRDVIIIIGTTVLVTALNFGFQILLARQLRPADFGLISSINVYTNLFVTLGTFGIPSLIIRRFGAFGYEANFIGRNGLKVSAKIIALITLILLINFIFNLGIIYESTFLFVPVIVSIVLVDYALTFTRVEEKYFKFLSIKIATPLSRIFGIFLLIYFDNSSYIKNIIALYVISAIFVILFLRRNLIRIVHGKITPVGHQEKSPNEDKSNIYLGQYIAFGLSGFFFILWNQILLLMASFYLTPFYTGIVSSALVLFNAAILLPNVILNSFLLPKLHRSYFSNQFKYGTIERKLLVLFLVLSISIYLLTSIFDLGQLTSIYGNSYEESSVILTLLLICFPFRLFRASLNTVLIVRNKELAVLVSGISAVLIYVVAMLICSPTNYELLIHGYLASEVIYTVALFFLYIKSQFS